MSCVVWIFCIPFFLRSCLTDYLYRKGGSLRRRLFVIKLWKPGRIFEFLSVAIFFFWGQVMDMFMTVTKVMWKAFCCVRRQKTVMYWYHSYLDLASGIFYVRYEAGA